ncbi:hypothetical protein TRFO_35167 [Tritrichomonas foetus]|uniref:Trafficking protein particle complex subunit 11 C-terminal domain-containing protein n=1 Tax=Tritrichomonas foetus TaxID=1144522 RepID=A0A1J4JLI7_9EUKA|nr:hypothetical protein TRFO_35167 [Tritrichomonas foetus]|eukprot:OHS98427.1 hypothetical protein TRFO_35167 [Tritrichomonas foetus]
MSKTDRQEVLQILESSKALISKENDEEAYNKILNAFSKILKCNFLPILDQFLTEHIKVSSKLGKNFDICTDYLIRLAPQVRTSNPNQVMTSLLEFLDTCNPMQFSLAEHFLPLFPIHFSVRYDKDKIIAGSEVHILTTIISHAAVPIKVDNVSYAILHDNNKENEEIISISDNFELSPRKPFKLTNERSIPPAISTELIQAVILKIKTASIRIPITNAKLSISPDISACNISIEMPSKCIIGAHLPFKITLTAAEQKIERLNVHFTTENLSESIEINGKLNDITITDKPTNLPDIEPFKSITLDMTVFSQEPSYIPITFYVNFGTALSGTGEFTKTLPFQFQSPFSSEIKFFDNNFVEIPSDITPIIEPDFDLTSEITLTNQIESYVSLTSIESSVLSIDTVELPVMLGPYETFSFLANVKNAGTNEVVLTYETEGIAANAFKVRLPPVEEVERQVLFHFISPPTAVLNEEFETTLVLERPANIRGGPEVVPVRVELGQSPGFFVNGPVRKHVVHIFRGQRKEIPIKFLPLEAGSTTLPQLLLTDTTFPNQKAKSFVVPIVVTYQ